MRKALLITIFVVIALGMSHEGSCGESLTHQYQCTSNNESLYFIMYERDGHISSGQMYLENMLVADLTLDSILSEGNFVVKVDGNKANIQINLTPDRILIIHPQSQTVKQICKCSYVKR